MEAFWLLVEAAEVLNNAGLLKKIKTVAVQMAHATREGLQPGGSLYHEFDRRTNHFDKHREWWVSAEAMVGFLNAFQLIGEAQYLNSSINAW
jgi:mannobiose 2-epimerase